MQVRIRRRKPWEPKVGQRFFCLGCEGMPELVKNAERALTDLAPGPTKDALIESLLTVAPLFRDKSAVPALRKAK